MAIEELAKPAGSWCGSCRPGQGCSVHAGRPDECRDFSCLWLRDERFEAHWKPNRSKMVLTASPDGIEIRCDPGFPDAWRKAPFRSEIQNLAVSGEAHDVTVLVIVGGRMTLLTSDAEFDLGVVGPDQRIVREISGSRVIGAAVASVPDLERQQAHDAGSHQPATFKENPQCNSA
jgi:hypothetical protein